MKSPKIVFIGCVDFSDFILNELIKRKINIIGICTKSYSKINSDYMNLSIAAKKNKIPYIYWNNHKSNDKAYKWIKEKNPDFIFCIGWPNLLKKNFLEIPRYFCVGFHPSDLPYNRGRHPIIWSIILHLKKIASSFFLMSVQADNGFILSKKKIFLDKNETAGSLYSKLKKNSKKQITVLLKNIIKNKKRKNSNHKLNQINKNSNILRKRSILDGIIDWRMTARDIDAHVRALSKPYSGASFIYDKKSLKIFKTTIYKTNKKCEPGKIVNKINNLPVVQTGDGLIRLDKLDKKINFKIGDYLI